MSLVMINYFPERVKKGAAYKMTSNEKRNDMENFRENVLNFINDFMEYNKTIPKGKIANPMPKEKLEKIDHMDIPQKERKLEDVVREMCEDILPYGNHSSHPRFFGFVPGTTSPLSWLGDIITTAYNRHAGSVANQPGIWRMEQDLIRWLNDQTGFPETAGGIFVSGGSMANLTALIAARDNRLSEEELSSGVAYISDQTHSSVDKALKIIGISHQRIRLIPTDCRFRMDTAALRSAIKKDLENGLKPFLVIATAGTTNTGSVDPFLPIRKICDQYHMWMHVDGSFGASVLLSEKYKHQLSGIETADSLSWDAHKWLFQTYGCAVVLVRDQKTLLNSFSVHPEYLKDFEKDDTLINPWDLGIELTRPARCIKLWLTLQVMGTEKVSDDITHGIEGAKYAESIIRKDPAIEIISPAQFAVINFRYSPAGLSEAEKNELNSRISEKILEDGYAGVFTTELNGKKVLRMCILNPATTNDDIRETLQLLDHYYAELMEAPERKSHIA